MKKTFNTGIPFIWMGMILAISFMEAPLKFQAPGISVELGLGIGRLVFFALNKTELTLALLLGLTFISYPWRINRLIFSAIAAMLLVQTFWLLPVLDERAELLLSGTPPEPAYYHTLYIITEGIKVILLGSLGYLNVKKHGAAINTGVISG